MMAALWAYRGFIWSSIRNEFLSRFARSRLGGLWMVIHPLLNVAIFALVLSNILAARLPGIESQNGYALYLMAGTLAWNLFSEIIQRSLNLFIEQANLLKKVRFPRIALPAILLGSCLLNNLLLFLSILVIFALMGHPPSLQVLWIPLLTIPLLLLASGMGLVLGIMNVFIRDIGQVIPVVLQVLFWFTPIVYPSSIIPAGYQKYLAYNPIYPIVQGYQQVLVYDQSPSLLRIGLMGVVGFVFLLIGLFLFRRSGPELVDAL
jgi:lipopolysaccharide transport system permease protein